MNILTGPSDEETLIAFKDLNAEEVFERIKNTQIDEKWFDFAVQKGLLNNLTPEEILLTAAEGGALKYVIFSIESIIRSENKVIPDILDDAMILAAKNGRLGVVEFLFQRGANINLAFLYSQNHAHVLNFAVEHGAKFNNKMLDKNSGEMHSLLWFILQEISTSLANHLDSGIQ